MNNNTLNRTDNECNVLRLVDRIRILERKIEALEREIARERTRIVEEDYKARGFK